MGGCDGVGVRVRGEGETDEVGGRGVVLTGYCMHAKVPSANTQVERWNDRFFSIDCSCSINVRKPRVVILCDIIQ